MTQERHTDLEPSIVFVADATADQERAASIADSLHLPVLSDESVCPGEEDLVLKYAPEGLSLQKGNMILRCDFSDMLPRIKPGRLSKELLVRAAKLHRSGDSDRPLALDATAGLGQDSLLLAAAGFSVRMYEQDPVIAALLRDALERAHDDEALSMIVDNMEVIEQDSVEAMKQMLNADESVAPDVIYLDPMFPARTKSAAVKKKFQLLHELERPCSDEKALFEAAHALAPRKLVVKRMLKGPFLAQRKPSYSLKGKSIRYDCYV